MLYRSENREHFLFCDIDRMDFGLYFLVSDGLKNNLAEDFFFFQKCPQCNKILISLWQHLIDAVYDRNAYLAAVSIFA